MGECGSVRAEGAVGFDDDDGGISAAGVIRRTWVAASRDDDDLGSCIIQVSVIEFSVVKVDDLVEAGSRRDGAGIDCRGGGDEDGCGCGCEGGEHCLELHSGRTEVRLSVGYCWLKEW